PYFPPAASPTILSLNASLYRITSFIFTTPYVSTLNQNVTAFPYIHFPFSIPLKGAVPLLISFIENRYTHSYELHKSRKLGCDRLSGDGSFCEADCQSSQELFQEKF
ncbi:MAG: hypothetical protein LBG27_04740, partial [Spirochaetaceae bacterium]|nr:hypothetical protein [Spirochaetaceae bacterium]